MPTLSAVLIVKNEGAALADCLQTLTWADELVVLDAGSTDNTVEIARRFTDKVYVNAEWPGFGPQRQRAQSYAGGDWILMVDADERVTPELRKTVESAVQADDQNCVYAVPRLSWVFGRFIRHSGWYPDYVIRLYPRSKAGYGDEMVHEKVHYPDSMRLVNLKGDLLHYTYRDLEHYLVKSAGYAAAWAQQRQAKGKRSSLLQGFVHGVACFLKMYIFRLGFLDGRQGLLLAMLSAHSTFVKYADLWIRRQEQPSE
ncbi:MAG: glycosyltransferase family 2 protein [Gammaproteobacteria bacterium]|nr:glycosyltransferase family 2 protein [Gammaproteobacteria bacterium]MDH5651856.1 glycosyltransferase family 2 protein [Gammaproteobacteria bacterium]